MRVKISKFTLALQNQKIAPLWMFVDENLIFSASMDKKHTWKNKSKKIFQLVKLCNFLKISDILIFFIGFYSIFLLWIRVQKKIFLSGSNFEKCEKIFVGHGANAEDFLFKDYSQKASTGILRINKITLEGLEKIGSPKITTLLNLLFKNSFGVSDKITALSNKLNLHKEDFLTSAGLNIGEYVFFSGFFRLAKLKGVREVIFLALHVAAHSCVHEKIKMIYFSHGLIKLSIPMIKPNSATILTIEEKKYLESAFDGDITCGIIKEYSQIAEIKKKSVVVMSPEVLKFFPKNVQMNFHAFLRWAKFFLCDIVFRPSPRINNLDLLNVKKYFLPMGSVDESQQALDERLKLLKPSFVAGFNTTGLFVALNVGILPISFCDPNFEVSFENMIYPMKLRVLFWPRDQLLIEEAIKSDVNYNANFYRLRDAVDSEF